jgi:hypothetical protein
VLLRLAEERNANSIGDRGFGGCQVIEEALLLMAQSPRRKVVPLRDDSAMDGPVPAQFAIELPKVEDPRRFPTVSTMPRLPLVIPDEILDYYGWVFCQGGFLNLHMTFEQFLAVVAAVSPSGLCPEYDDSGAFSASE